MSRHRSGDALVFSVATALVLLHAIDDAIVGDRADRRNHRPRCAARRAEREPSCEHDRAMSPPERDQRGDREPGKDAERAERGCDGNSRCHRDRHSERTEPGTRHGGRYRPAMASVAFACGGAVRG
jgi:hypothetical protein